MEHQGSVNYVTSTKVVLTAVISTSDQENEDQGQVDHEKICYRMIYNKVTLFLTFSLCFILSL